MNQLSASTKKVAGAGATLAKKKVRLITHPESHSFARSSHLTPLSVHSLLPHRLGPRGIRCS